MKLLMTRASGEGRLSHIRFFFGDQISRPESEVNRVDIVRVTRGLHLFTRMGYEEPPPGKSLVAAPPRAKLRNPGAIRCERAAAREDILLHRRNERLE